MPWSRWPGTSDLRDSPRSPAIRSASIVFSTDASQIDGDLFRAMKQHFQMESAASRWITEDGKGNRRTNGFIPFIRRPDAAPHEAGCQANVTRSLRPRNNSVNPRHQRPRPNFGCLSQPSMVESLATLPEPISRGSRVSTPRRAARPKSSCRFAPACHVAAVFALSRFWAGHASIVAVADSSTIDGQWSRLS